MRVVFSYLDKVLRKDNRCKPYSQSLKYKTIEMNYKEEDNYTKVDLVLEKLNLSEGEQQVLDIYMSGYGTYEMCRFYNMKATDTLIILGDVGVNYSLDGRDALAKKMLSSVAPTVLCIHGNHEIRPNNINSYKQKEWNGGVVWFEDRFPNLLFARVVIFIQHFNSSFIIYSYRNFTHLICSIYFTTYIF